MPASNPVKHVVVLMLENRSFDQLLGDLQSIHPKLDGIDPKSPRTSHDYDGNEYRQLRTSEMIVRLDPHHDLTSVLRQIGAPPAMPGRDDREPLRRRLLDMLRGAWGAEGREAQAMRAPEYTSYFVAEYVKTYDDLTDDEKNLIMGYYPFDTLPALHTLAKHFVVCDRWFSSVPGPTWVNRFFFHSGTAQGIARMPEGNFDVGGWALHDQRTIYDELNHAKKSWRIISRNRLRSRASGGRRTALATAE